MKKSKLMQGRAAIAKKLAALTRIVQDNKAVVPNLLNQVRMLREQSSRTAAELEKARADAMAFASWTRYWENKYWDAVEAYSEQDEQLKDLKFREQAARLTAQRLPRFIEHAKQQAMFNLVVGTVGWLGLVLTVSLYAWR